ncbi:regulatory LuxR family protein [Nocardia caishijiensis]|uniref:Regulatory LuxR family protein n=1 Tax=Nocardia caishijiensis TaxID=184756 RepID=A0ABQ6YHJ9_9NOCA|nr:regulatory LuxR family protein [Nocardia caishijiensis]
MDTVDADTTRCPYCGTPCPTPAPLSAREREVLRTWLLSESKTQVAEQLFITRGTINTHLSRARCKYAAIGRDAPTKSALLARALQDGIVGLHEL